MVTDTLPPGLGAMTIVPSQGACTRSGDTITCQLGNLTPNAGTAPTIQISGSVPADSTATSLVNSATVTSPAAEPIPGAGDGRTSSSTTTTVQTSADVLVSKRADVTAAVPGQPVRWTITVANTGPSVARDVAVTDALPPEVTGVAFVAPAGVTCDQVAGVCTIPTLRPRCGIGDRDRRHRRRAGGRHGAGPDQRGRRERRHERSRPWQQPGLDDDARPRRWPA